MVIDPLASGRALSDAFTCGGSQAELATCTCRRDAIGTDTDSACNLGFTLCVAAREGLEPEPKMRPAGPPEERNRTSVREERFDESLRRRPERIQEGRAAHRAQKA